MSIKFTIFLLITITFKPSISDNIQVVKTFLESINQRWATYDNMFLSAEWNYLSNLTEENVNEFLHKAQVVARNKRTLWDQIMKYPREDTYDFEIQRQFELFSKNIYIEVLSVEKYSEYENLRRSMMAIPGQLKIPRSERSLLKLSQHDVEELFSKSRDHKQLLYLWTTWNTAVGMGCRKNYQRRVELLNEAAHLRGLPNAEALWLELYSDIPNIKNTAKSWWKQLKPFYEEFHAYVRYKLSLKYGDIVDVNRPIPAHLTGNLFGKNWRNVKDIVLPYPITKELEIEECLKDQGYTPLGMMRNADDFMLSLNFDKLSDNSWSKSIFEHPEDGRPIHSDIRNIRFFNSKEAYMLNCLRLTASSYFESHWMAARARFELTSSQPYIFQSMPTPSMSIALSSALVLSARSSLHLRKFWLLEKRKETREEEINNLLYSALDVVAFLPYSYVFDLWRWSVFSGETPPDSYNTAWWELMLTYAGVEPFEKLTERSFYPGMKMHILQGMDHFKYYMGTILSFQIHRALCTEAGLYLGRNVGIPLHECDIYGSFEAGDILKKALMLGRSRKFHVFLEILTGERHVNTSALLEYYEPLMNWLKQENIRNGVRPGWVLRKSKELRFVDN